jgi:hypothetical protein
MPAGARGFMAPKRRATTKAGRAGAQSPGRHLSAREVKKLIAQYSQSAFQPDTQNALRRDLNKAISDFQFRRSYAIAPTQAQFRKRFNGLHAALKRVKAKLPPADSQNDLFNYIRRLGEAYARVHGPHPHIEPRELSLRGLGLEDEVDFNSAQRLRELIESVHQISCWMEDYDENLVPKVGWSMLEKGHGRTHSPELWLIGKQLPKIFDKYFRHSKGGDRAKQLSDETYSRCDHFVVAVLDYAGIRSKNNKRYSAHTVEKYRSRAAQAPEGFELTDNLEGFERTDNLD